MAAELPSHVVSCVCGAVEATGKGDPVGIYACHCSTCRKSTSAPFFTLAVFSGGASITKGADQVFSHTLPAGDIERFRCKHCGGLVMAVKVSVMFSGCASSWELTLLSSQAKQVVVLPASQLPAKVFKITGHQYYESRVMDVNDNAPKFVGT